MYTLNKKQCLILLLVWIAIELSTIELLLLLVGTTPTTPAKWKPPKALKRTLSTGVSTTSNGLFHPRRLLP